MKIVTFYEYASPNLLLESDKAPAPSYLSRRVWKFEIRFDHKPGVAVALRAVIWERRATARHKWTGERAWYQFVSDCNNPRMMPSDYFVRERPEVSGDLIAEVLRFVRASLRYESEMKR